jgi:serine/threonine protein kinase
MPRLPQPGNLINGYTITRHINTGAMANAYEAKSPSGEKVFFKQYKSPSVALPWFKAFVEYNREMNRRIEAPELQRFCVRNLASFESTFGVSTFFQVFEFIEGGHDLGTILERAARSSGTVNWEQRLIMAKVIMAAINQLHDKRIVHADLKPANIQMINDKTIKVRWQPKLIDMDRSVLADQRAPWHGYETYVGTPRYFSPEHFEGLVPEPASDVFTCGIILYELLAQGHPFRAEDEETYKEQVRRNAPSEPKLSGALPDESATRQLMQVLRRCLLADPKQRPTAMQVARALNGQPIEAETAISVPITPPVDKPGGTKPKPVPDPPVKGPSASPSPPTLVIQGPCGSPIRLNVRTMLGIHLLRQIDPEALGADEKQFAVERRDGGWWIEPVPTSHAWTTLNKVELSAPARLSPGDQIALRGRKSGKTAMNLTISFGDPA